MTFTHGSTFSGIGGIDLGFEQAGAETLWTVEKDKPCRSVLARHFPQVERYEDVTKVKGEQLARVDVLSGGVPCQDWSLAGKREGISGERSGLFFEFADLADYLAPRWVLFENVPGLLSAAAGEDFATIIEELTGFRPAVPVTGWRGGGFARGPKRSLAWRVLDAQYFGLAQRRKRVFVVADSRAGAGPVEVLLDPDCCEGDPAPRRAKREELANAVGTRAPDGRNDAAGLVPVTAFAQNQRDEVREMDVAGALAADPGAKQQTYVMRLREGKPGGGKGALISDDLSLTLATGNDQTVFAIQDTRGIRNTQNGLGVSEEEVSYTLDTTGDQGVSVTSVVRKLTPLECERLQGFPEGWTEGQSDAARYRQLGNAVAVPVARWVAERMMKTHAKS